MPCCGDLAHSHCLIDKCKEQIDAHGDNDHSRLKCVCGEEIPLVRKLTGKCSIWKNQIYLESIVNFVHGDSQVLLSQTFLCNELFGNIPPNAHLSFDNLPAGKVSQPTEVNKETVREVLRLVSPLGAVSPQDDGNDYSWSASDSQPKIATPPHKPNLVQLHSSDQSVVKNKDVETNMMPNAPAFDPGLSVPVRPGDVENGRNPRYPYIERLDFPDETFQRRYEHYLDLKCKGRLNQHSFLGLGFVETSWQQHDIASPASPSPLVCICRAILPRPVGS
jgi:hypothetical protein